MGFFGLLFIIFLIVLLWSLFFGGKSAGKNDSDLPTTDAAFPIYGLDKDCASSKGGGASIIVRMSGIDFSSMESRRVDAFNERLAEIIRLVSVMPGADRGGNTDKLSNIEVKFFYIGGENELEWLVDIIKNAESQAKGQDRGRGLAGLAYDDTRFLTEESLKNGQVFWSREFGFVITITNDAVRQLLNQQQRSVNAAEWEGFMEELASGMVAVTGSDDFLDFDGEDEVGSDNEEVSANSPIAKIFRSFQKSFLASSNPENRYTKGFTSQHKRKPFKQFILDNLVDGWQQFRGDPNARKLDTANTGGIATHPVPAVLSDLLHQKANIVIDALRPFGVDCAVCTSAEAAKLIAKAAGLPTRPLGLSLLEMRFQTAKIKAAIQLLTSGTFDKDKNYWTRERVFVAIGKSLTEQGWKVAADGSLVVDTATATKKMFMPASGNASGQVDAAVWGGVPMVINPNYVLFGVPLEIEQAQAGLIAAIKVFRRIQAKPPAFAQVLENELRNNGYDPHHPRPQYLSTLVGYSWEISEVQTGQFVQLIAQTGIPLNYVTFIKTPARAKLKKQLERSSYRRHAINQYFNDPKAQFEQAQQDAASEGLQAHLAGGGNIHLVGIRVTVKANSEAQLTQHLSKIKGLLQTGGLTVYEATYDQAFGLFSTMPVGRDFISDAPLTGKRTVRNMVTNTLACLFPALIPDPTSRATSRSLLQGQTDSGGLTIEDSTGLINPHWVAIGMSGIGKTLSRLLMIGRSLYSNPNLFVRLIDPQNVTDRNAREWGGVVAHLDTSGTVRFNFLDRFSMGGAPQVLSDLSSLFLTTVIQMQQQGVNVAEKTAIKNMLKMLFLHCEQGVSVTHYLVKGLYNRFFEEMGFAQSPDPLGMRRWLEMQLNTLYDYIYRKYNYFENGFVVAVRFTELGDGRRLVKPISYRYMASDGTVAVTEPGVVIRVLNTVPGVGKLAQFNRNYYRGDGYTLVEIPLSVFKGINTELDKYSLNDLEREAWLARSLTAYLAGPYPRRQCFLTEAELEQAEYVMLTATATNVISVNDLLSVANSGEKAIMPTLPKALTAIRREEEVVWVSPPEDAELSRKSGIVGSHLFIESGPVWYAEEAWQHEIEQDFNQQLSNIGMLNSLDYLTRQKVGRDLMMPLKMGTPILQDFIPLIASEKYGVSVAENLESYCDPIMHGEMFNGHTNTVTSSRFYAFAVKNLTDELRPLRMMQALEIFWREIASNPPGSEKEYLLVVDEFGIIANQSPETRDYVALLYKRARALNTTIGVMEQNIGTFENLAGEYILDNTGVIQLMKQSPSAVNYWAARYQNLMTDEDCDRLENAGVGEALMLRNESGRTKKEWVRYSMHENTLKVLSTKPSDVQKYQQEVKSYRQQDNTLLEQIVEAVLPIARVAS